MSFPPSYVVPFVNHEVVRRYQTALITPPKEQTPLMKKIGHLVREGFTAESFKLPCTLNKYLEDNIPNKKDRTKENVEAITVAYKSEMRQLATEYMHPFVKELAAIVLNCVPVTDKPTSKYRQFRYYKPQEYSGNIDILEFMELITKGMEGCKKKKMLIPDILVLTDIFYFFMRDVIHEKAKGKEINFVDKYTDVYTRIGQENYPLIFTNNQPFVARLVPSQFKQLEAAVLAGKTYVTEPTPQDAIDLHHYVPDDTPTAAPYSSTSLGSTGTAMGFQTGVSSTTGQLTSSFAPNNNARMFF